MLLRNGRTTRHAGYAVSQLKRKRIEACFGWMKTVGGLCKTPVIAVEPCSNGSSSFGRRLQSCAHSRDIGRHG
jgi:hypothetical protein